MTEENEVLYVSDDGASNDDGLQKDQEDGGSREPSPPRSRGRSGDTGRASRDAKRSYWASKATISDQQSVLEEYT